MKSVGAYEAKSRLSSLLEAVKRGERFTILKHGVPIALLLPVDERPDPAETIEKLRRQNRGRKLGAMTIRDLIREGRRR